MRKRVVAPPSYWYNPDIFFTTELEVKGETILPGMYIKVKNHKEPLRFLRIVRNQRTDTEWVDVVGEYGFFSVRPDKILSIAKKRSQNK